jgi:hypothetical protein
MNRTVIFASATLIAVVLIYLGCMVFIGWKVESAISRIEAELIQSDNLIVHGFEYKHGFGSGVLRYDLELSTTFDGVAGELLAEIAAEIGELRTKGELDVIHGPWLGAGMGLAAAGTKLDFQVSDEFRRLLPQYPGSAPAATVYASAGFDGSVRVRLETLAYDGRLVMQDESISLTTAGFGAEFVINDEEAYMGLDIGKVKLSDGNSEFMIDGVTLNVEASDRASELAISFNLDELSLTDGHSETQFGVRSVAGTSISISFLPGIWLGGSDFAVERVSLKIEGTAVEALNSTISSMLDEEADGRLATHSIFRIGELIVAGTAVKGIELGIGFENINASALSDFLQLSEELDAYIVDSDAIRGVWLSLANALAADELTLTIAPIALSS